MQICKFEGSRDAYIQMRRFPSAFSDFCKNVRELIRVESNSNLNFQFDLFYKRKGEETHNFLLDQASYELCLIDFNAKKFIRLYYVPNELQQSVRPISLELIKQKSLEKKNSSKAANVPNVAKVLDEKLGCGLAISEFLFQEKSKLPEVNHDVSHNLVDGQPEKEKKIEQVPSNDSPEKPKKSTFKLNQLEKSESLYEKEDPKKDEAEDQNKNNGKEDVKKESVEVAKPEKKIEGNELLKELGNKPLRSIREEAEDCFLSIKLTEEEIKQGESLLKMIESKKKQNKDSNASSPNEKGRPIIDNQLKNFEAEIKNEATSIIRETLTAKIPLITKKIILGIQDHQKKKRQPIEDCSKSIFGLSEYFFS